MSVGSLSLEPEINAWLLWYQRYSIKSATYSNIQSIVTSLITENTLEHLQLPEESTVHTSYKHAGSLSHLYSTTFFIFVHHHGTKKPVTTMLTYPWKCTVLHCNHLGNTWKPLVLMTRHFDYCPSASEGDNQSVRSSAPVVSRCFPGGYNVKLDISRGRLA